MPELPEVQALAELLRRDAVGRTLTRVDVVALNALKTFDPPPSALHGRRLAAVERRGKFLDLALAPGDADDAGDELHLVVHLARAGWLRWSDPLPAAPPRPGGKGPLALRVHLDGPGFDLTEAGTQKRLAAHVVRDPAEVPGVSRLGTDPLDDGFTPDALATLLRGAGGSRVKTVLTDQSVLAGVGNAYSDEVLWHARLSPFAPADKLDDDAVRTLHHALVTTLGDAVAAARGVAGRDLKREKKSGLQVHARTGLPCPRCGDEVRQVAYADKSMQYCATCQTGGRVLADRRLSRLLK